MNELIRLIDAPVESMPDPVMATMRIVGVQVTTGTELDYLGEIYGITRRERVLNLYFWEITLWIEDDATYRERILNEVRITVRRGFL